MDTLERLLYRELYKKSFYEFVKAFWSSAEPNKFVDGWLVEFYCEVYQYFSRPWVGYTELNIQVPKATDNIDVIDVREGKNKCNINVPPRHTKSMIFNVLGPVWNWLNSPVRVASVSHTGGLASKMNTRRQKIISSELFQSLYGNEITLETNSKSLLVDQRGGELYSINRNAFTGYGGDIIINDDLTNAETARKDKEEMNNAWSYYQNTMPSRINDINKCVIYNIQQRLAPNDITGHILNNPVLRDQYTFIVLPAIFEKETYVVFPISGKIKHLPKGSFLWPERFGDYESLKREVGETVFQTQYLQKAIASDKTVIKQDMIIEKDACDVPSMEQADIIYASHDFPVKDKDSSDFLGSLLGYRVGSNLYLTDCLEKKMAFVKSVAYVKQLDQVYPGIIQVIEDKANGSPILQQLQDEVAGMQAFQPGTDSKTQRLESASLYMNSKNVIFVRNKFDKLTNTYQLSESLNNLKNRLINFPFVEHDDICDAFSMLVLFVFMERRYMVYGRSFDDKNIIDVLSNALNVPKHDYSTVFFNKEGDVWKALEIGVVYGTETKLVVEKEIRFKASIEDGFQKLKEFSNKKVFIDCSATDGLNGMYNNNLSIERYEVEDFDKSVAQLNLAFSKKRIMLYNNCVLTKSDIENFKFNKSKNDNVKYITEKDGFCACLRIALKYYGGIV